MKYINLEHIKSAVIDGKVSVIIGFKKKPGPSDTDFIIGQGGKVNRIFTIIDAISTTVPEKALDIIKKSPNVEYIELDEKMFAHVPVGTCQEIQILKQITPWGINRIGSRLVNAMGNTGKGIKIGILDTGIDSSHEDLKRNYKGGYNFVDNNMDLTDLNGHGCCHPATNIYTTLCGLTKIEDFYSKIDSEEISNDDKYFSKLIRDEIFTLSYVDNNKIEKRKIKSVHKVPINQSDLVQINDILLTPWHNCFVFNQKNCKIEEKRADNVKIYDYIISPGRPVELNTEYRTDRNFLIDEDFGYLLGIITGNGSVQFTGSNKRIDLSISDMNVVNRCINICNNLKFKIADHGWQERCNYYRLIIYNDELTEYVYKNIKTLSVNAKIPDIVTKSPVNVMISFLSGLIDTDGNVKSDGTRIRISSSSKELISRLYIILSLLGQRSYIVDIKDSPHVLNGNLISCTVQNYQIVFHIENIGNELLKYMSCIHKKNSMIIRHNKNNSIPVTEKILKYHLMSNYGIKFNSYTHRCKCCGKMSLCTSREILSKNKLMEIFKIIDKKDDYFYNIANNFNFVLVKDIKRKQFDGFFYDLTMEDSNNYVAGISDMIFIHNTHVAGIIAAEDNDIGIVGVSPEASIYSVRVLDFAATGTASDITAGFEWCLDNNMQIVNMSLGTSEDSISVARAADKLYDNGILLIAAAGNNGNGQGTGDNIDNPAKYPSVIAVGATDINDGRASFSSTGPKIELSAPGKDIYSTMPGNKYASMSGTSMSSPHTTGVAALIKSAYPGMTNVQVRIRMQIAAQNIAKNMFESKSWFGYGLIDAVRSVSI